MQNLQYCELFKKYNKTFKPVQIKYACVFLKNEAVIVTKDDNVYHLINNGSCKIIKLCQKGVIDFAYSYSVVNNVFGYHILALTGETDGLGRPGRRVYGWGRNNYQQVSPRKTEHIFVPERLKITKGPVPARVSKSTPEDIVTTYHCCSCCPSCSCKKDPYESFKLIACGFGHCMAITMQNNIIIWGNNKLGQIGNGEKVVKGSPIVPAYRIIVLPEAVKPSFTFSGCFSASWLFCTGYLPSLLPLIQREVKIPKLTELLEPDIIEVGCGSFHSVVLFSNGNLYGWGDNSYGQLGHASHKTIPTPLLMHADIIQVKAANLYTLALTSKGVLFAMGDNTYAQLGNNEKGFYQEPIKIPELRFSKIATINQLTMALTNDMEPECYIWGLYKMVKKPKIPTNPNSLLEANNQPIRQVQPTSVAPSYGQVAAIEATQIIVDKGINAIESALNPKPDYDCEEEGHNEEDHNHHHHEHDHHDHQNDINRFTTNLIGVINQPSNDGNFQEDVPEQFQASDVHEDDIEKLTYIITKPTKIECKSFEKITAKVLSLTNFTIKFDEKEFDPNENDETEIIDLALLVEERSGMSEQMRQNIKILGEELQGVGNNKIKVFFGNHNKFSVISDSYVLPTGDLNIKDIQMTATKMVNQQPNVNNPV